MKVNGIPATVNTILQRGRNEVETMRKITYMLIPLIMLMFTGCGETFSTNSVSTSSKQTVDSMSGLETNSSNIESFNSDSSSKKISDIKILYAKQESTYIYQGYFEPHYMIYYIDKNYNAYSAMWKTNDIEPSNVFNMTENFINIEALGSVSLEVNIDAIINDIRQKKLLVQENEDLDIDPYGVWIYGHHNDMSSESPILIYQFTSDTEKILDDSQTTLLVNALYSDPTFQAAQEIWNDTYDKEENHPDQN